MTSEVKISNFQDWKMMKLSEVTNIIFSGGTPNTANPDYWNGGIPWLSSGETRNRFISKTEKTISQLGVDNSSTRLAKKGTIVIASAGQGFTRSQTSYLMIDSYINQSIVAIQANPKIIDTKFLFYILSSRYNEFRNISDSHSSRGSLTTKLLAQIDVPVPPLIEQQKISEILFSIDSKIELNYFMNETLRDIAQVIFKSWFIDFNPVQAKIEGKRPAKMTEKMAELFPSEYEEIEGKILPKGWRVIELGDIANIVDCLHAKKPERQENGKPYLQLNNIRDDGLLDLTDTFSISSEDYKKWINRIEGQKGDCVITNAGRVGAVSQIPDGVKAALGRNMTGIRLKEQYPYPTFLIQCLLSQPMRQEIEKRIDRGTVLDSLNVRNIPKLRLIFPVDNPGPLKEFESLCRPLRQKMERNLIESQKLTEIRNTLLPKLISGELRIEK